MSVFVDVFFLNLNEVVVCILGLGEQVCFLFGVDVGKYSILWNVVCIFGEDWMVIDFEIKIGVVFVGVLD